MYKLGFGNKSITDPSLSFLDMPRRRAQNRDHNHKHSTPISGRKKTKTEKAAKKLKGKHNPKNQKAISYNIIRHTHAKTKQNCVGIPHETQKKKKKETQQFKQKFFSQHGE